MPKFRVTYDIVTPESAEHGDSAERGFVMPGGWQYDIETVLADKESNYSMSLRDAINLIGCVEDSGSWFTETDGRQNYKTGAETTYSLHPPDNITGASYRRLARLLKSH